MSTQLNPANNNGQQMFGDFHAAQTSTQNNMNMVLDLNCLDQIDHNKITHHVDNLNSKLVANILFFFKALQIHIYRKTP